MSSEKLTNGPLEARTCKDMPADVCDYGVVSLSEGREICRVWREADARAIEECLNTRTPDPRLAGAVEALRTAVGHIEHMSNYIGNLNKGIIKPVIYSFESLGEDMPGIRAALSDVPVTGCKLVNCVVKVREGDAPLFNMPFGLSGLIYANLDGYTIVPNEFYQHTIEALQDAADEIEQIIMFYHPEGWHKDDLSDARALLPRLRDTLSAVAMPSSTSPLGGEVGASAPGEGALD